MYSNQENTTVKLLHFENGIWAIFRTFENLESLEDWLIANDHSTFRRGPDSSELISRLNMTGNDTVTLFTGWHYEEPYAISRCWMVVDAFNRTIDLRDDLSWQDMPRRFAIYRRPGSENCRFRIDPIPGTRRHRGRYFRKMHYKQVQIDRTDPEFKPFSRRSEKRNLDNWEIEPIRSRWSSKSWKDHSKRKRQWKP
jgi:hypothetical protein